MSHIQIQTRRINIRHYCKDLTLILKLCLKIKTLHYIAAYHPGGNKTVGDQAFHSKLRPWFSGRPSSQWICSYLQERRRWFTCGQRLLLRSVPHPRESAVPFTRPWITAHASRFRWITVISVKAGRQISNINRSECQGEEDPCLCDSEMCQNTRRSRKFNYVRVIRKPGLHFTS